MVHAGVRRVVLVPVPVGPGVLWLPIDRDRHRPLSRRPAVPDRPPARPAPARPGAGPRASLRQDFRSLLGERNGGARPRPDELPPRSAAAPPPAAAASAGPGADWAGTGARTALLVATGATAAARAADPRGGGLPDPVLRDVERLRAVLADPTVGGYAVTVIADHSAQEVRLGVEDFLADRTPDDQVLVHVAAPSLLDAHGRLAFGCADTRPDRLASTSLDAQWLAERLDECPARRQVVVLDVGHGEAWPGGSTGSGAHVAGAPSSDATADPGGRTRVVLAAGTPDAERPPSPGDPSLTALLAHGLGTGQADADADGLVTLEEVYAYVRDRSAARGGALPRCWVDGRETLLLARNPNGSAARATHAAALHAVQPPAPDSDLARAMRVARSLDPAQALAAVQGLDAAEVLEVARALRLGQPAPPPPQPPPATGGRRRQIGDVLVENGVLTPEQLQAALDAQSAIPGTRPPLGKLVVELGMAGERQVAECLAQLLHLELVDLAHRVPDPDLVRMLPRAVAERTRMIVIDRTPRGEPVVAASDPTNVVAFDDVRLYTRSTNLKVCIALDTQITDQLNRAWSLEQDTSGVAEIVEEAAGQARQDEPEQWQGSGDDDAPIVRLVTQILSDGVRQRASDIHIEVQRDTLRVRYRVDGLLRDVMEAPRRVATSVISRIKIISGLDIAERRIPQDGRTRLSVEGMDIDCRVSTLPSLHGEKVVIRLLTRGDAVPELSSLGLEATQLALFETALAMPQGLVLITGPTGSGKTNTLYSAIARIRAPELNIVTLEDPVEVQLPGITQVGVSEKTGMTFSRGLRAILRQDPDVILVGEVRDAETAQLALKAAMTGHLVLTTLHTNSAVAALTRLVDMGAEPFVVASSLTLAVAQRLVRRPCQACAVPYLPDELTLHLLGLSEADLQAASPRRGGGCQECGGTGYRGRTAVYEVLEVDTPMRQVLLKDPSEASVAGQAASAGMIGLRDSAIGKALAGATTFEEALRVTSR